jgi:hypothetical protein
MPTSDQEPFSCTWYDDDDEDDYSDGYDDDNMGSQFGAPIPSPFAFPCCCS